MLNEAQKQSRGQALAEAFFFRMDQELIASLRKKLNREEKVQAIKNVTGIRDPKVIECLVDAGFDLSTATAFVWAPVLFVAWADGNADQLERLAILEALPDKGVSQEAATMMIAHKWFTNRPTEELWQIWENFAAALLVDLNTDKREALMNEIVDLCYVVAQASGGLLGIGKVSLSESEVIERVIAIFEPIETINELEA